MDFLLITQPRTGTYFLRDLLNNSNEIKWFEGLDLNFNYLNNNNINTLVKYPKLFKYFSFDYIKKFYNLHSPYKKVGNIFSLSHIYNYNNINFNNIDLLNMYYKINSSLKVILLKRKNLLKQYVSVVIRNLKDKDLSFEEKERFASKSKINFEKTSLVVKCDYSEFLNFFYENQRNYENLKNNLYELGLEVLTIDYEEITLNTDSELLKIKSFLNLKNNIPNKSKFFKLESRPLSAIISNYNEFSLDIQNSPFAKYLE